MLPDAPGQARSPRPAGCPDGVRADRAREAQRISIPIRRAGGARLRSDAGPKAGPGRAVSRIRNPAVCGENRKVAGRQRWNVWGIPGGGSREKPGDAA